MQNRKTSFLVYFLRLFLPIAIIVIVGGISLFESETVTKSTKNRLSEEAAVQVGATSIKQIVQSITSDLAFLAEQETFIQVISSENSKLRDFLIKDWQSLSRTKGTYDQIRWLDANGQEQMMVNFNNGRPVSVTTEKLQNKGGRYYFKDAIKLNKGEFFISPLDLNIEHGKIELPLKPMIRIGTPVFDLNGKKQGIILLNYLGKTMLEEFGRVMGNTNQLAWLLNCDGFWFKGPSSDLEWGFMYQNPEASMAHRYPRAWKQILSREQGQFEDGNGLWTFTTVYPLVEGQKTSAGTHETFAASRSGLESKDYCWKSVLLLPADEYRSATIKTGIKLLAVTFAILVGLFAGSWRLASAWVREEEVEEELRRINLNLERTVDERTKELRHEIKERQKIEDELRDREERFRSITATSSVAMIITVDDLGNVITWNSAAERTFGYKESEVLGQSLTAFMPERYRAAHREGLERAVKTEVFHIIGKSIEVHGLKKNGEEFPIELSLGSWKQGGTRYFSAVIHDISERKLAEEELKHMATHDSLTGLPMRHLCLDRISSAVASARRNKDSTAVLFIDLDGFKAVNDTMGHDAGDYLLVSVSQRLIDSVREVDAVARIGGDEFVVILVNIAERSSIANVANKLVDAISQPFQFNEEEVSISASIGIALYPDDAEEPEELLQLADTAMYSVKNRGKNNYSFAGE